MESNMNEKNVVEQKTAEQNAQNKTSAVETEEKKKPKQRRKTVNCKVDHSARIITITRQASIPGTEAFKELADCHKDYPDYKIVYRTAKVSDTRILTNNLTVDIMRQYIKIKFPNDATRLSVLNTQENLSKLYPSPISYMRKWFRKNYPEYWKDASPDKKSEIA